MAKTKNRIQIKFQETLAFIYIDSIYGDTTALSQLTDARTSHHFYLYFFFSF